MTQLATSLTNLIENEISRAKEAANDSTPTTEQDLKSAYRRLAPAATSDFEVAVRDDLWSLGSQITEGYQAYGRALFDPVGVFSRAHPYEQLLARIDANLALIRTGRGVFDEVIASTLTDLVLLRLARKGRL